MLSMTTHPISKCKSLGAKKRIDSLVVRFFLKRGYLSKIVYLTTILAFQWPAANCEEQRENCNVRRLRLSYIFIDALIRI